MKIKAIILLLVVAMLAGIDADAQRRKRPGSMKHGANEATEFYSETKATAKYIKAGAVYTGTIYVNLGTGNPLPMGKATLRIKAGGKYSINFDFTEMRTTNRPEYGNIMDLKTGEVRWGRIDNNRVKLGEDFSQSGSYSVISKEAKKFLELKDEKGAVMEKVPLDDADGSGMYFGDDSTYINFSLVR